MRVGQQALVGPGMPIQTYTTYVIRTGNEQTTPASCEQVDCDAYRLGWVTTLDVSTEAGQRAMAFLTAGAGGRHYVETTENPAGPLRTFRFEPGQRCFAAGEHRVQLRPSVFARYPGWLGQRIGDARRYDRPDQWVDDFATHQETLADAAQRG